MISPIHPGDILKEEYLIPYALSANKLAARLDVPTNRITSIIAGTRS
ncbi:MAG TPA: addiction module antidote protein, HigA family, partial [Rhodospirillales bacterium]|nr:addiction module antidote protein, HigA family [Rhodospirillales bacterium]